MPTIYIDDIPYAIEDTGQNLLQVCLSLGLNLPYFCWHPAMHSVGACRQCAVKQFKDEHDTRGRLIMACMTPAKDGTRISIDDPEAVAFRAGITEWMMVNHPHDCPVCDEGGECHLQDMTVMTGHVARRARFRKRTYCNQDLGPFVTHQMNRCIQCYRCVRYYREIAHGRDLDVFAWHDHVYFGRAADGVLESPFSGNLVEICPTGVFTDKTLAQHYTRKWDLQTAPSVCVLCGVGCNTIPGERYGTLRRIRNRYHHEVNGYFLCDRGRYGYEFVNSDRRIRSPLVRESDGQHAVDFESARAALAPLLGGGDVIGIGSPRASMEANFALQSLVGPERFYTGESAARAAVLQSILEIMQTTSAHIASQQDVAKADAILILGEDLHQTAPMLALAVMQSGLEQTRETLAMSQHLLPFDDHAIREIAQDTHTPLFLITPVPTGLDADATDMLRAMPDDIARLGYAVAHAIDASTPAVTGLTENQTQFVQQLARALGNAKRPVIIAGASLHSEAIVQAAANIAHALHVTSGNGQLCFTVPECNSLGLALLEHRGHLGDAAEAVRQDMVKTVILLELDLCTAAEEQVAETLLAESHHVITLDVVQTATTDRAAVVLPAAAFAEADGTLVNHEGRAQRFFQVFVPVGDIRASWRWLGELFQLHGYAAVPWQTLDALLDDFVRRNPALTGIANAAPRVDFRLIDQRIAREPARYSGRTAMTANRTVHEPPPPSDADAPFTFSMEGYHGIAPAPLLPRYWWPGWNSVQALNKFQQEVGGPLHGGPAGVRMIIPSGKGGYVGKAPSAFSQHDERWYMMPQYHIFGSEPLSRLTPGIAALAPAPYVGLSPTDAKRIPARESEHVAVVMEGRVLEMPVRIFPWVQDGTAVLTVDADTTGIVLPGWAAIIPLDAGSAAKGAA